MNILRVVVAGNGFSGAAVFYYLEKYLTKARQPIDLIYVSDRNYYCTENYLSELLTGSSELSEVCQGIRNLEILKPGVSFMQTDMLAFDLNAKKVKTTKGEISYNYLICTPTSDSGISSYQTEIANSFILKSPYEVKQFKNHIAKSFEAAVFEKNTEIKKQLMTFTLIGDDVCSIEQACSISDYSNRLLKKCFPELNSNLLKINMFVESECITPDDSLFYSSRLFYQLKKKGINILLNSKMIKVKNERIEINGENLIIPGTIVFLEKKAGSSLIKGYPFRKDENNRACVDLYFKADGFDDVFVIGECSRCLDSNENVLKTSLYYKLQAKICAENMLSLINNNPLKTLKTNIDLSFISLGYRNSMMLIKGFYFDGLFPWVIHRLFCIWLFLGWKKKLSALIVFLINTIRMQDFESVDICEISKENEKIKNKI